MAEDTPENADLPRLFKGISEFEKLLLLRYLRPDRMISALQQFVSGQLGHFFVEPPTTDLQEIEKEADKFTPLFIVLFPGVDPTPVLEITARSKGCTAVSCSQLLTRGLNLRYVGIYCAQLYRATSKCGLPLTVPVGVQLRLTMLCSAFRRIPRRQ